MHFEGITIPHTQRGNLIVSQAFTVIRFSWNYVIPVSVFAYCYSRIFHTIRRQSKVITGHAGRSQGASGNQTSGQIQQQGTAAATGGKLSHTEMNVLETMITIIVVFMLFWSATSLANFLLLFGVRSCKLVTLLFCNYFAINSFSFSFLLDRAFYVVLTAIL